MPLLSDGGGGVAAPRTNSQSGRNTGNKTRQTAPKQKPAQVANPYPAYDQQQAISRRVQQPAPNYNSNGGGGGGYAAPTSPAAPKPAAPVAPPKPSFDQWLAKDSDYQSAFAAYNLQLEQAKTARDANVQAAQMDQTNQVNDWQTQFDRGSQQLLDDFASRGLGNSGLFADAKAKYTSDSEATKQALMDAILRRIQGEDSSLTGTTTNIQQQIQEAKNLAAKRGAGQFSGTV